ncbi:Polycomb group RING finger protein 3 [Phytophthora cinnamomi]|uniref:Polycomb group RING finger protein 3 n=1 Tax=Phytophthora cinnamomi TaxID=4785 RepID=UPI00355A7A3A|nr:Polycomb group RING finger protein 3 [Phytophthora cinnamomi]
MALDARTVTVRLAELTEHLGCALCRGILRDAHTIPDCLHSFCKSCIYRHFLVKGSCICPKCNKTLNPRPIATLITDQKLQEVVDRIFPEFKEQEVILEKEFYAQNNFKLRAESTAGKDGEPTDGANGSSSSPGTSSRGRSKASTPAKKSYSVKPGSSGGILTCNRQFTIEVYPQETNARALPPLKFPFMQMFELRKLIRKRLKLPDELQLEMACMGATVGPELSVHFIQRTIWQHQNQKEPLVLHYRRMTS